MLEYARFFGNDLYRLANGSAWPPSAQAAPLARVPRASLSQRRYSTNKCDPACLVPSCRSIILRQMTHIESTVPFAHIVTRMQGLLAAKASNPLLAAECAWDMLQWSLEELVAAKGCIQSDSTEAQLKRAGDLDIVRRHGGFRSDATLFVTHALVKQFGSDMLSDEGLRRLASSMREPVHR